MSHSFLKAKAGVSGGDYSPIVERKAGDVRVYKVNFTGAKKLI